MSTKEQSERIDPLPGTLDLMILRTLLPGEWNKLADATVHILGPAEQER